MSAVTSQKYPPLSIVWISQVLMGYKVIKCAAFIWDPLI